MKMELAPNYGAPRRPKAEKLSEKYRKKVENDLKRDLAGLTEPGPELLDRFEEAREAVADFLRSKDLSAVAEKFLENSPTLKLFERNKFTQQIAFYLQEVNQVWVDKLFVDKLAEMKNDKADFYLGMILVHENVHAASVNYTVVLDRDKESKEGLIHSRCGYTLKSSHLFNYREDVHTPSFKESFGSFNEGVTEMISSLVKNLSAEEEKFYSEITPYGRELELARAVLRHAYAGEEDVLIGEYFAGGLQHLRRVEKFYGPGSLSLLSELRLSNTFPAEFDEETTRENLEKIKKGLSWQSQDVVFDYLAFRFFVTESEEERIRCREFLSAFSEERKRQLEQMARRMGENGF